MSLITRSLGAGYTSKARVRKVGGITTTDVPDADLDDLIQAASIHLHGDIAARAYKVPATALNAGLTRFQTHYPFIADANVDSIVNASDITVEFVKRDQTTGEILSSSPGVVTVEDAARGIFTTANAKPTDYECLTTHDYYRRPLDLSRADEAVAYLAAHLCTLRMKGPGALSVSDLTGVGLRDHGNRTSAYTSHRTKYLKEYEMLLKAIRGPGGVLA